MKIDFIYVINLTTDSNEIRDKILSLNFKDDTNYYEFPAVNGWDIVDGLVKTPYKYKQAKWWKLPNNPKEPQNDWWSRDLTPGEIGCVLSHYSVIEGAYNSGYENVLILEEDFKFFLLIILISSVSQTGDLIISYFKRLSKIKNTGNIFPGHGGLLDRIDGMIFAFPFTYIVYFLNILET